MIVHHGKPLLLQQPLPFLLAQQLQQMLYPRQEHRGFSALARVFHSFLASRNRSAPRENSASSRTRSRLRGSSRRRRMNLRYHCGARLCPSVMYRLPKRNARKASSMRNTPTSAALISSTCFTERPPIISPQSQGVVEGVQEHVQ